LRRSLARSRLDTLRVSSFQMRFLPRRGATPSAATDRRRRVGGLSARAGRWPVPGLSWRGGGSPAPAAAGWPFAETGEQGRARAWSGLVPPATRSPGNSFAAEAGRRNASTESTGPAGPPRTSRTRSPSADGRSQSRRSPCWICGSHHHLPRGRSGSALRGGPSRRHRALLEGHRGAFCRPGRRAARTRTGSCGPLVGSTSFLAQWRTSARAPADRPPSPDSSMVWETAAGGLPARTPARPTRFSVKRVAPVSWAPTGSVSAPTGSRSRNRSPTGALRGMDRFEVHAPRRGRPGASDRTTASADGPLGAGQATRPPVGRAHHDHAPTPRRIGSHASFEENLCRA